MAEEQHVYTHPSRVEHWRHLIEIVALSLAAIWALYVFVYQERLKPASEGPALDEKAVVTHTSMRGGKELVSIALDEKNIGSVDVQIAGEVIDVYGVRYGSAIVPWQIPVRNGRTEYSSLRLLRKTVVMRDYLLYEPFGGSGVSEFSPGREKTQRVSFSIALPEGAYDAVHVLYNVCYQRADNHQTFKLRITTLSDGSYEPLSFVPRATRPLPGHVCANAESTYAL